LALSRVTDIERSDALQKRFNMIKLKSEMITPKPQNPYSFK